MYQKSKTRISEDGEIEKSCTRCGEFLPRDKEFFHGNKNSSDGLEQRCKACRSRYVDINREHINAAKRKRRRNMTPDQAAKAAKINKTYRDQNKTRINFRQNERRRNERQNGQAQRTH